MSLSYKPLQTIIVQDPLLMVDDIQGAGILQGPSQLSWQSFTTTAISTNNIAFSVVPPQGVCVDRRMRLQLPVRYTLTGRAVTTNAGLVTPISAVNAGYDAPRAFPVMTMTNSINVQINNDTFTLNVGDSFPGMVKYNMDKMTANREYSTTAAYTDQSQNYASLIGTARNPLGNFASNTADILRGAYPFRVVTNVAVVPSVGAGTACTAIIDVVYTEDVCISPLFFLQAVRQNAQGLFGINNLNVSFNFFQGLGGKFWSHANAPVIVSGADNIRTLIDRVDIQFNNFSGAAFSFPEAIPTLQLKFLTPSILHKPMLSLQGTYTYPYYDLIQQTTTFGTIPYSASGTVQRSINSITLAQIPTSVYLMVKPSSQSLQNSCMLTDSCLPISAVNITFGNVNSILSGATQVQLFDLCVKNGLHSCSWPSFSGLPIIGSTFGNSYAGCGSVIKLNFGEDIFLPSDQASGMANGNFQFSATITVANRDATLSLDAIPMDCLVVFVTSGSMTYSAGNISHQVAIISSQDVINSSEQPGLNYRNFRDMDSLVGGSFLDTLSNWGSKINDFLKESKVISTLAPLVPLPYSGVVGSVAKNLGYGMEGGYTVGGMEMSKSDLKRGLKYR